MAKRMSDEQQVLRAAGLLPPGMGRRDFLRLATLAGITVSSASVLAACGESTPSASGDPSESDGVAVGTIAQFITSVSQDYWSSYNLGFAVAVPALGCTADTQAHEEDPLREITLVRNAAAQGVRMAVGTPATGGAALPELAKVCEEVEMFHARVWENPAWFVPQDAGRHYVLFTTHNGAAVAEDVARTMFAAIGDEGDVLHITGAPGSIQDQRQSGFDAAFAASPGIRVVGTASGGWTREGARTAALNLLGANPGVKGVIASNDSMATGVLAALRERGLDDVKVTGLDGIKEVVDAIATGDPNMFATHSTVPPFQSAFMAARVFDALNGVEFKTYERMMFTGSVLVTAANAEKVFDLTYGQDYPFDVTKMSRVLSGDEWNMQHPLVPIEPESFFAYDSANRRELHSSYVDAKAAGEYDEIRELYASRLSGGPFEGLKIVT